MQEETYRAWLRGHLAPRPLSDSVSRCRRIEKGLGTDLDAEYACDGGAALLARLAYGTEDAALGHPAPAGLAFAPGADLRGGLASLRSAAAGYFKFCACRAEMPPRRV